MMNFIIRMFPTIINYYKWNKTLKENSVEIGVANFSFDFFNRIGFLVSLKEEDIYDIKTFESQILKNSQKNENIYQMYIDLIEKYKDLRIFEKQHKLELLFKQIGLYDQIDYDNSIIDVYDINNFTFEVNLQYYISKGLYFTFPIDILFTFFIYLYAFFKYLTNK